MNSTGGWAMVAVSFLAAVFALIMRARLKLPAQEANDYSSVRQDRSKLLALGIAGLLACAALILFPAADTRTGALPQMATLFGMRIDASVLAGAIIVAAILLIALILRLFVISKFQTMPAGMQLGLEAASNKLAGLAERMRRSAAEYDTPKKAFAKMLCIFLVALACAALFGLKPSSYTLVLVAAPAAFIGARSMIFARKRAGEGELVQPGIMPPVLRREAEDYTPRPRTLRLFSYMAEMLLWVYLIYLAAGVLAGWMPTLFQAVAAVAAVLPYRWIAAGACLVFMALMLRARARAVLPEESDERFKKVYKRRSMYLVLSAIALWGFGALAFGLAPAKAAAPDTGAVPPALTLFGGKINESVLIGWVILAVVALLAVLLRVLAVPRFKTMPEGMQFALERFVCFFTKRPKKHAYKSVQLQAYTRFLVLFFIVYGCSALAGLAPAAAGITALAAFGVYLLVYYAVYEAGGGPVPLLTLPFGLSAEFAAPELLARRLSAHALGCMIVAYVSSLALGVLSTALNAAMQYLGQNQALVLPTKLIAIVIVFGLGMLSFVKRAKKKLPESDSEAYALVKKSRKNLMMQGVFLWWIGFGLVMSLFPHVEEGLHVDVFPPKVAFMGMQVGMSVLIGWAVVILVLLLAVLFRLLVVPRFRDDAKGPQMLAEMAIDVVSGYIKEKTGLVSEALSAYLITLALFLVGSAVVEMAGFRPPTTDLMMTFSIALITFGMMNYYGIKEKGGVGRVKSFAHPTPLVFPFKILSDISAPVSLACRLFGNMLGGMIVMHLVYMALGSFTVGVPAVLGIYFNAFHPLIQVFIFITLSLTFISEAVE